jgi:hypothetical protein
MTRKLPVGVVLLVLVLYSLPALAAPADPGTDPALAAIFAPAPETETPPAAQDVAKRPSVGTKSTCTATCWNVSQVSCSGTDCSAVNSNCSTGQRGYCSSSTSGTVYCPACPPPCTATATCRSGGSRSCTGYNNDCYAINNCYAFCEGNYYFCQTHSPTCSL